MTLRLGIDTGGTYTDAVVVRTGSEHREPAQAVVSTAKSLTTRHNLAAGIGEAVQKVLAETGDEAISLVALSTTLATNAVVEGYGAPSCLLLIGQPEQILERAKLGSAIGADPVLRIAGGHDASGMEAAPLDCDAIEKLARKYDSSVSGFAVASYFAVRNTAHELEAQRIIQSISARPVTCSHQLSAALDAPRRALTALFNARLVPLLTDLIDAVHRIMQQHDIDVPLMLVQGDGSLVEASMAVSRPVETILSGPAASVIGARWIANIEDAVVSDIGGTTTDVAVIRAGRPDIDPDGATVGDWRTMVRAVRVQTSGLGGDSEVGMDHTNTMTLGPRRAIPLTILARDNPQVGAILEQCLSRDLRFLDGAFGVRLRTLDVDRESLTRQELGVWDELASGAVDLDTLFADPRREKAFARLRRRGLVAISTFTPTDGAHVLGLQQDFDRKIATDAAAVWARRLGFETGADLAEAVCQRLIRESAKAVIDSAMLADGQSLTGVEDDWFVSRSLEPGLGTLVAPRIELSVPVVGIGAPAPTYYPEVGALLNTEAVVPVYASVCNAIGAAIAKVVRRSEILVTSPVEFRYRLHGPRENTDYEDRTTALDEAESIAREEATSQARLAGATDISVEILREEKIARGVDGSETFVECRLIAIAEGEPRLV